MTIHHDNVNFRKLKVKKYNNFWLELDDGSHNTIISGTNIYQVTLLLCHQDSYLVQNTGNKSTFIRNKPKVLLGPNQLSIIQPKLSIAGALDCGSLLSIRCHD